MHILSVIYNGINRPQSNCCRATTVLVTRFHSYDRQHSSRLPLNRFDSRLPRLASNVVHQLLAQRQAELLLLRWLIKLANVILQVAPTKRTHALQHRNQEFSLMNETKTFRRGFSNGSNLKLNSSRVSIPRDIGRELIRFPSMEFLSHATLSSVVDQRSKMSGFSFDREDRSREFSLFDTIIDLMLDDGLRERLGLVRSSNDFY